MTHEHGSAHGGCEGCGDCERMLQGYVDRVLTAEEIEDVEAHLAECSYCARCYRFEVGIRQQLKQACSEPCPDTLRVRLQSLCHESGVGPADGAALQA